MKHSCERCRQRKVACDQADPCSACSRSGVACVFVERPPLPRGRNGGRRKEAKGWKARLAKLEALVDRLENQGITVDGGAQMATGQPDAGGETSRAVESPTDTSHSRYIGRPFWSMLSAEMEGLKEVLSTPSDPDSDDDDISGAGSQQQMLDSPQARQFDFALCGGGNIRVENPEALQHPPPEVRHSLVSIYFSNVDALFKILHGPTVRGYVQSLTTSTAFQRVDPAVSALLFAIYYAAVMTRTEAECDLLFGVRRDVLLDRYRFATEASLSMADFLNSDNLVTLQAFVVYLVILRSHDNGQRAWTLTALAVQVARGMGLHYAEDSNSFSPFQKEMRSRLWHQLCVLDVRAALDRAAEPIIPWGSYDTPLPSNINDEDLSPDCVMLPPETKGITESSFSILTQQHCAMVKRLNMSSTQQANSSTTATTLDWKQRQQMVEDHRQTVATNFLRYCDDSIPLQWFSRHVHELVLSLASLMAVRPLWPRAKVCAPPPQGSSILELAVDAVRRDDYLHRSPMSAEYSWYLWVNWYVVAVALAELCGQPETPYVQMAWEVVERVFERHSELIADSKKGRLWQPVKKLMKKAQSMRRKPLTVQSGTGYGAAAKQVPFDFDTFVTSNTANISDPNTIASSTTQLTADDSIGSIANMSYGPGDAMLPEQYYNNNTLDPMIANFDFDPEVAGSQLAWNCWDGFVEDFGKMDSSNSFINFT